jgi:electron transport complex protein RnfC
MRELKNIRSFSGGLPLRPYKALSTEIPISRLAPPDRLVLAMTQHAGPPACPIVSPGQHVTYGEVVGAAADPQSVTVHSPAAGTVVALEERLVPTGTRLVSSLCVIVATESADPGAEKFDGAQWPADTEGRLRAIRDAGLVGLGGAAFPTASKLGTKRPCHTLILNGAECEPYISCDDMLLREHPDSILSGAVTMLDLLHADRCIVAIEQDKIAALTAIRRAILARDDSRFVLAVIPTVYPAGGERQLVESLLGEEVPSGGYPIDIGVICQNVGTAHALTELVIHRQPLLSRIVTVTGHGLREPRNIETPIGTPIRHLIAHCGGLADDAVQLILGGNMMGYALPSDDIPVTKSTNCVIALSASEAWMGGPERPCIRCGDCAAACPARLLPQELLRAARAPRFTSLTELGLADCIECGCCDVVCPSHIPLTAVLRDAKGQLDVHLDHLRRAAAAQERYAEHLAREARRVEKTHQEQERLKAPLDADEASRRAAIEAAVDRVRKRRDDSDRRS